MSRQSDDFDEHRGGANRHADIYIDGALLAQPATTADPHLLDSELTAPSTAAQYKHLTDCGWCRERLASATAHPDPVDDDAFMAAARTRATNGGVRDLQQLTRLPAPLHAFLLPDEEGRSDVHVGELWRLRTDDATELAQVVAIDRWWVTIAPVTTDVEAADEHSAVLSETATVLGIPLAICYSLECVVPLFTFDRLVTAASAANAPAGSIPAPEAVRQLQRSWRRGDAPPAGFDLGDPVVDGDLDRRELRNAVAVGFEPFVAAGNSVPGAASEAVEPSDSLADLLRKLNMPPSKLHEVTGLPPGVFTGVAQGKRINATEAAALTGILSMSVEAILAANPPFDDAVVEVVSRPQAEPLSILRAELEERGIKVGPVAGPALVALQEIDRLRAALTNACATSADRLADRDKIAHDLIKERDEARAALATAERQRDEARRATDLANEAGKYGTAIAKHIQDELDAIRERGEALAQRMHAADPLNRRADRVWARELRALLGSTPDTGSTDG